jgi:hypothetical protein
MNTVLTRIPEKGASAIVAQYSHAIITLCLDRLNMSDPTQQAVFAEIRTLLTKLQEDHHKASNELSNMVEQLR